MPPICSVSQHPDRATLEAMSSRKVGLRSLVKWLEEQHPDEGELVLSKSALGRHLSGSCSCGTNGAGETDLGAELARAAGATHLGTVGRDVELHRPESGAVDVEAEKLRSELQVAAFEAEHAEDGDARTEARERFAKLNDELRQRDDARERKRLAENEAKRRQAEADERKRAQERDTAQEDLRSLEAERDKHRREQLVPAVLALREAVDVDRTVGDELHNLAGRLHRHDGRAARPSTYSVNAHLDALNLIVWSLYTAMAKDNRRPFSVPGLAVRFLPATMRRSQLFQEYEEQRSRRGDAIVIVDHEAKPTD